MRGAAAVGEEPEADREAGEALAAAREGGAGAARGPGAAAGDGGEVAAAGVREPLEEEGMRDHAPSFAPPPPGSQGFSLS
jgi:hypothetical protein